MQREFIMSIPASAEFQTSKNTNAELFNEVKCAYGI